MSHDAPTESDLDLPEDLLVALQRHNPASGADFRVEAWKPSLVTRMFGFLDRGRSRE